MEFVFDVKLTRMGLGRVVEKGAYLRTFGGTPNRETLVAYGDSYGEYLGI